MNRKVVSGIILTLLLTSMLTLAFNIGLVKAETYYYNFAITVTSESPTTYDEVSVTVSFDTACINYDVSFSPLSQSGNDFFVTVDIYVPEVVVPMIGYEAETYYLGKLSEGSYTFYVDVRVWYSPTGWLLDQASYNESFTIVTYIPELSLETDKHIYKLGENITIILTNIGSHTVEIGGYPAWQIFTYPEKEPVFPKFFLTMIWSLDPGENDTFIWKQLNEFTWSFVEPGKYVVEDNKGWGLSAYFTIVDADVMVPDDYPTIQEAINHANEGDTIFVRNGTYYENVVVNRLVSLVGDDSETTVIDGGDLFDPNKFTVLIDHVNGVSLRNFAIRNGYVGIYLSGSNNAHLTTNTIIGNGHAMFVYGSANNLIDGNIITDNYDQGICLWFSSNNSVTNNNVASNNRGVLLDRLSSNSIVNNNIVNNTFGILLYNSSANIIYHNNIMNNTNHLFLSEAFNNTWDNGCEGNYWSDYNGTNITVPPDGIGDTYLPWQEVDYYPLMNPYWNPTDINHDLKVDIKDIATAALAFGSYPGHPKWNPHADITGPEPLEPDGQVDIRDIALTAKSYGKTYP